MGEKSVSLCQKAVKTNHAINPCAWADHYNYPDVSITFQQEFQRKFSQIRRKIKEM